MRYLISFLLFSIAVHCQSQNVIAGQECVTPGVQYTYINNAGADSSAVSDICIEGGILADAKINCQKINASGGFHVIWDSLASQGNITVTNKKGKYSFSVTISKPLSAGSLDEASKLQYIGSGQTPLVLQCSPASGGSCTPQYLYQWQISDDAVNWKYISGANEESYSFSESPKIAQYYRRRVTEQISKAVSCSDMATILINEQ